MLRKTFSKYAHSSVMGLINPATSFISWNPQKFQQAEPKKKVIRINQDVQIHKCDMVSTDKIKNDCFMLMKPLRGDDVFPKDLSKEKMVELFFPKTSSDMAQSLSNVTSAFYGIMLQETGKIIGIENIDKVSQNFFYSLGKTKTILTKKDIQGKYDIPSDARGVVILFVSAIYNASPEYKFDIKKFDADHCEIELNGMDRYLRITKTLGISQHLQWPVLHRFMQGINDELQAGVQVKSEMLKEKDDGECHERFTITRMKP